MEILESLRYALRSRIIPGIEKMVPFYGTVYKSILYDLIIPFPACESGAATAISRRNTTKPPAVLIW